jgi:sensor histidine kinase YesM
MYLSLFNINKKTVISWYLFIITVNLILGIFFWAVRINDTGLMNNVIFPQTGALIKASIVLTALYLLNPRNRMIRFSVIILSIVVGATIASLFDSSVKEVRYVNFLFGTMLSSIIYGSAFYWESLTITKANLEKEQINRLEMEKRMTEAKLMTLQAQIEPHFLFNTLSNILNLFDTDIEKGKSMQKDLIHYLESSLSKIRTDLSTIGDEIKLVIAYLNIFKVRMEDRLKVKTNIPDHLNTIPFPAMLIQPLVENAIKHGIEPKIEGGEISIRAERQDQMIRIEVADTGLGLGLKNGTRTGLSNIRERLSLQYGDRGQLKITENTPTGIKAIIEVPDDNT